VVAPVKNVTPGATVAVKVTGSSVVTVEGDRATVVVVEVRFTFCDRVLLLPPKFVSPE
jgi:hypothetical protein